MLICFGVNWLINLLISIKVLDIGIFGGVFKWIPWKNREIVKKSRL